MKRNSWMILAVLAIAAMFFVPRAAYSFEAARLSVVPLRISAPAVSLPGRLPATPAALPGIPTLPSRRIPGPFVGGNPTIQLPSFPRIMPALPYAIRMAETSKDDAAVAARLDASYDNARVHDEAVAVVVIVEKDKKKRAPRQMLPEAELELEIGIIQ